MGIGVWEAGLDCGGGGLFWGFTTRPCPCTTNRTSAGPLVTSPNGPGHNRVECAGRGM